MSMIHITLDDDGFETVIEVRQSGIVCDLKCAIGVKIGVEPSLQRIWLDGTLLNDDDAKLSALNVVEDTTLRFSVLERVVVHLSPGLSVEKSEARSVYYYRDGVWKRNCGACTGSGWLKFIREIIDFPDSQCCRCAYGQCESYFLTGRCDSDRSGSTYKREVVDESCPTCKGTGLVKDVADKNAAVRMLTVSRGESSNGQTIICINMAGEEVASLPLAKRLYYGECPTHWSELKSQLAMHLAMNPSHLHLISAEAALQLVITHSRCLQLQRDVTISTTAQISVAEAKALIAEKMAVLVEQLFVDGQELRDDQILNTIEACQGQDKLCLELEPCPGHLEGPWQPGAQQEIRLLNTMYLVDKRSYISEQWAKGYAAKGNAAKGYAGEGQCGEGKVGLADEPDCSTQ